MPSPRGSSQPVSPALQEDSLPLNHLGHHSTSYTLQYIDFVIILILFCYYFKDFSSFLLRNIAYSKRWKNMIPKPSKNTPNQMFINSVIIEILREKGNNLLS